MRILILFTTLLAWFAPASAQRKADLSRLVVLGDSLSAGYQNGSLLSTQQVHGYGNLLAEQAGVTLSLPLIAPPGIPNVLVLLNPGPPPIINDGSRNVPRAFGSIHTAHRPGGAWPERTGCANHPARLSHR